jgi:hypothetical protein
MVEKMIKNIIFKEKNLWIFFIKKIIKKLFFFLTHPPRSIFRKKSSGRHAMLGGRNFNKLRGQTATRGARSVEDHSLILLKCSTNGDQTINHAARDWGIKFDLN